MRGDLQRPQQLIARQRYDDLTANARHGDRSLITPRIERGIRHDDRMAFTSHDRENVVSLDGPYRQLDLGHATQRTLCPDHSGRAVDEQSSRGRRPEPRAEVQHGISVFSML